MPQTQHSFSFEYNRAVSFLNILFFRNIIELYHQVIIFILYSSITQLPVQIVNLMIFLYWFWPLKDSTLQLLLLNFMWCSLPCLLLLNLSWTMLLQFVAHPSFWLCPVLSPWPLTKTRAKFLLKTGPSMFLISLCCFSSVLFFFFVLKWLEDKISILTLKTFLRMYVTAFVTTNAFKDVYIQ